MADDRDAELERERKRLAAYIAKLRFVKCVGGVVLHPDSRPKHGRKVKR